MKNVTFFRKVPKKSKFLMNNEKYGLIDNRQMFSFFLSDLLFLTKVQTDLK